MTKIESVGAYAPAARITAEEIADAWGQFEASRIEQTAVPDADEDVLTMAHEAATLALESADREGSEIRGLFLGTTTPPMEEEAVTARLASTLGLGQGAHTRQLTGSTRAGLEALVSAIDAAGAVDARGAPNDHASGPVLVVASDAPRGAPDSAIDHAAGAGATALVVGPAGQGEVRGRAEQVRPVPGTRFRPAGSEETTGLGVTTYDRNAFRETVGAAADGLGEDVGAVDAVALQSPDGSLPYRVADRLGVGTDAIEAGTTVHDLGDTGAASPLLGLASALTAGHDDVAVVGYGSGGGAIALRIEGSGVPVATDLDARARLTYPEYLRRRGVVTSGAPDGGGAYVSVPSWTRTIPQRHRLVAGRCRTCGALAFPPSGACSNCGTVAEYESVRLPGTGTVEAATEIGQGGAPPEFVEQQARSGSYVAAVVGLDGPDSSDDTVSTPAQVLTVGDQTVDVGDRVTSTIRQIYTQEGVTRYGVKFRVLED